MRTGIHTGRAEKNEEITDLLGRLPTGMYVTKINEEELAHTCAASPMVRNAIRKADSFTDEEKARILSATPPKTPHTAAEAVRRLMARFDMKEKELARVMPAARSYLSEILGNDGPFTRPTLEKIFDVFSNEHAIASATGYDPKIIAPSVLGARSKDLNAPREEFIERWMTERDHGGQRSDTWEIRTGKRAAPGRQAGHG